MKQLNSIIVAVAVNTAALLQSGCESVSWGSVSSSDAFKVSVLNNSSGIPCPEIIAGGGTNILSFQKPVKSGEIYLTDIKFARRKSFWGIFSSNADSGNISFSYVSGSQETPEDTIKILRAMADVVNAPTAKPDSGID